MQVVESRTRMVQVPVSDDGPIGRAPMIGRWLTCFLLVRGTDASGEIQLRPGPVADAIGLRFGVDPGGRRVLRRIVPLLTEAGSLVPSPGGVVMPEWARWNKHGQLDPWRRAYRAEPGRLGDTSVFARGALIYLLKVVNEHGVFEGVAPTAKATAQALLRRRGGAEGWVFDRALQGPLQELLDGGYLRNRNGEVALDAATARGSWGRASVRAEATQGQPDDHAGTTQGQPDDHAGTTQGQPDDHAGTTQGQPDDHAGTTQGQPDDHMKTDASTRKDSGPAASVFLSNLPSDVRSDTPSGDDVQSPPRVAQQLVLTMVEPPPPPRGRSKKAAVHRAANVGEPPPPPSMPGARELWDVLTTDPMYVGRVDLPGDFACRCAVNYADLDIAHVARDAAEFLSRPSTKQPTNLRAFLRNQFDGALSRGFALRAGRAPASRPTVVAVEAPPPAVKVAAMAGGRPVAYDPLAARGR